MAAEETPTLESLLPARVRERIEPPDRARNEKVTARFTDREYALLARFAGERQETVTAVVRKLALATIDDVATRIDSNESGR